MIGKYRKYCAPRSIAYPLQLLDVVVDRYAQGAYRRREYGAVDAAAPAILLMSSGHLGDALMLTYTFPLIKARFPDARIDILAGSWCDPIWKGNPYINRVVHLDHVNTNRRAVSRWKKWRTFSQTTRSAIQTLRDTVYDYSVDIRFSAAPMHFVLPYLKVRRKIGFGTRGFGGLLDDEFFMPDGETHNFELILQLFRPMGIEASLSDVKPYFPVGEADRASIRKKLPFLTDDRPVVLCFPESGAIDRFLPTQFWVDLSERLLAETQADLIFCGQLTTTSELAQAVQHTNPDAESRVYQAVKQLNLNEIAALSERAIGAFTLESLPVHLCSIFCPTAAFFYNGTGAQFYPVANYPALVLHNHRFSQSLTLDRPGFRSEYVTNFDGPVIDSAMDWFRDVTEPTNSIRQL